MNRWVGKVAVVTGASAGIGAAITESLVKEGVKVVGLARRSELVEKLSANLEGAKGKLYAKQCDVGKEKELQEAFEWVKSEFGGIDILVNNAGVWSCKRILDDDNEGYRKLLDLAVLATAICTREAVASMQSRKVAGHIININSIDGHWLPPYGEVSSLYTSTKHAVTAMTEQVRRELVTSNSRIRITSVSPGYVKTDLMRASGIPDHENYFDHIPYLQPEDIANGVLYILGTPENVQVTELTIRAVGEKY